MTAQFAIRPFPAAERLCGGRQTGRDAEIVEEPIKIKVVEILAVAFLRVLEEAIEQTNLLQIEHSRLDRDFHFHSTHIHMIHLILRRKEEIFAEMPFSSPSTHSFKIPWRLFWPWVLP
jgi:hypothetical protein